VRATVYFGLQPVGGSAGDPDRTVFGVHFQLKVVEPFRQIADIDACIPRRAELSIPVVGKRIFEVFEVETAVAGPFQSVGKRAGRTGEHQLGGRSGRVADAVPFEEGGAGRKQPFGSGPAGHEIGHRFTCGLLISQHAGGGLGRQTLTVAHYAEMRRNVLSQGIQRGQDQRQVVPRDVGMLVDQVRMGFDVIEIRILREQRKARNNLFTMELVFRRTEQIDVFVLVGIRGDRLREESVENLLLLGRTLHSHMFKNHGPMPSCMGADEKLRSTGENILETVLDTQIESREAAFRKTRQRALVLRQSQPIQLRLDEFDDRFFDGEVHAVAEVVGELAVEFVFDP
jgi:hypothetical protein